MYYIRWSMISLRILYIFANVLFWKYSYVKQKKNEEFVSSLIILFYPPTGGTRCQSCSHQSLKPTVLSSLHLSFLLLPLLFLLLSIITWDFKLLLLLLYFCVSRQPTNLTKDDSQKKNVMAQTEHHHHQRIF